MPVHCCGTQVCCEVLVRDEFRGRVIDITGPQAISHHQIADAVAKAINRKVQYQDIAYDKFREAMKEKGLPGVVVELQIGNCPISMLEETTTTTKKTLSSYIYSTIAEKGHFSLSYVFRAISVLL